MSAHLKELIEECSTPEEIRQKFSLSELVELTRGGNLQSWLKSQLLDIEAKELSFETLTMLDDEQLKLQLCRTLNIDVTTLPEQETQLIELELERERPFNVRRLECGKEGVIVTNQRELAAAFKDEAVRKIFLCDNEFVIPTARTKIIYEGRGNAVINIKNRNEMLNFDDSEIYFYDLTLLFHYLRPDQVMIEHSSRNHNKIIFLRADRIALDDNISALELEKLLMGRLPFERSEQFRARVQRFKGLIAGTVLLNANDYDVEQGLFFVRPLWKIDFVGMIRRYVQGSRLCFKLEPEEAKKLFEEERKQLVCVDFDADDDQVFIKRLFIMSKAGNIYEIKRFGSAFDVGSSSGGASYNLQLSEPEFEPKLEPTYKRMAVFNNYYFNSEYASIIVLKASLFKSKIQIKAKGKTVDAKSIPMIMSIGLVKGTKVTFVADGADAKEAVNTLVALINSKFGED